MEPGGASLRLGQVYVSTDVTWASLGDIHTDGARVGPMLPLVMSSQVGGLCAGSTSVRSMKICVTLAKSETFASAPLP